MGLDNGPWVVLWTFGPWVGAQPALTLLGLTKFDSDELKSLYFSYGFGYICWKSCVAGPSSISGRSSILWTITSFAPSYWGFPPSICCGSRCCKVYNNCQNPNGIIDHLYNASCLMVCLQLTSGTTMNLVISAMKIDLWKDGGTCDHI